MGKTTVYYNSACPVCRAGIDGQRERMRAGGVVDVEWIDVHRDPRAVEQLGASLARVRERLHVRDADGRIHVGTDALAALFLRTPRQHRLGRALRAPCVRPLARLAYNAFARALYLWNRARRRW
jgi:predicted DCC family thiol-disulfide oxidoreductase YuxK